MHLLLVLMVLIWGGNYAVIKLVLRELPPEIFNAVRLLIASTVFLGLLAAGARTRPTRRDWLHLAGLGFYGQFLYQLFFLNGVARTSVANASLIVGLVPAVVAVYHAAAGHERLAPAHWIGIAVSIVGMYFVVGLDAAMTSTTLTGDLLTFGSVLAWSAYTIAARPLLARHSPLFVTGWSMAIGTLFYLPYAALAVPGVRWSAVSAGAWIGTVLSALISLNLAYIVWNTAVQRIGGSKTSIYSNVIPVAAVASAAIWLDEPIDAWKVFGGALIILGLLATRIGGTPPMPAEE